MFWIILFYALMGWLLFQVRTIKRFNDYTPGVKFFATIVLYGSKHVWDIIGSLIFLIVVINWLNLGLANWLLTNIFMIPLQAQSPEQLRPVAFMIGLFSDFLVNFITKGKLGNDAEVKG